MTGLEITLIIILYIALGLWICQKRKWYRGDVERCVFSIIVMPINLIIIIFREFILGEWSEVNY